MRHILLVHYRGGGLRLFDLVTDRLVIGYTDVEINLESHKISRRHAILTRATEGYVLEDTNSRNGTFVNGRRIHEPCLLNDGDTIRFAEVNSSGIRARYYQTGSESDRDLLLEDALTEGAVARQVYADWLEDHGQSVEANFWRIGVGWSRVMKSFPTNRKELIDRFVTGEDFDFLFFWGHTPPNDESVNRSCLSQWFDAGFEIDGVKYKTAEHWMMAEKARAFGDDEMLEQIIAAPSPKEAKALGRNVSNFDQETWFTVAIGIVRQGSLAKFTQNEGLAKFLLSTGNTIIVEAAPRDVIWGIGLGVQNELAVDPTRWRGRNLLGFILTDVRQTLAGA